MAPVPVPDVKVLVDQDHTWLAIVSGSDEPAFTAKTLGIVSDNVIGFENDQTFSADLLAIFSQILVVSVKVLEELSQGLSSIPAISAITKELSAMGC